MSQKIRAKMSGKEARYILQQNNINLSWLSELLGIKPQSLQSRLNAATFSPENQLMINKVTGRRIFDIDIDIPDIEADANRILQESITPELIQLKAVEKWDGKLPLSTSGNTLPFLELKK